MAFFNNVLKFVPSFGYMHKLKPKTLVFLSNELFVTSVISWNIWESEKRIIANEATSTKFYMKSSKLKKCTSPEPYHRSGWKVVLV